MPIYELNNSMDINYIASEMANTNGCSFSLTIVCLLVLALALVLDTHVDDKDRIQFAFNLEFEFFLLIWCSLVMGLMLLFQLSPRVVLLPFEPKRLNLTLFLVKPSRNLVI